MLMILKRHGLLGPVPLNSCTRLWIGRAQSRDRALRIAGVSPGQRAFQQFAEPRVGSQRVKLGIEFEERWSLVILLNRSFEPFKRRVHLSKVRCGVNAISSTQKQRD
jgi:hypothetical protein